MLSLEELKLLKDIVTRASVPVDGITSAQIGKARWVLDREIKLKTMNPMTGKDD